MDRLLAIYPLRYAVLRHPFPVEQFPTLDVSPYADLGKGYYRGVRELRTRTHVYLLYTEDGDFKHKHYEVIDGVQFSEVVDVPTATERVTADESGNAIVELPPISAAHGFVTAPLPTADRKIGDAVYLLTCDTPLTAAVLGKLARDEDGLRTATATEIKLKGSSQQSHTLSIADLKKVPALEDDEEKRLKLIEWSESQPQDMLGAATIEQVCLRRNRQSGQQQEHYPPIAVVLRDPVGVMSELGHITGTYVLELQAWSDREQIPRKAMVSRWIDALAQQKARSVELETVNNDPIGAAIPGGVGGGAANAARDRAYRAGLEARRERLSHIRDKERLAFMSSYEKEQQTYLDNISGAAALATRMYNVIKPQHDAVMRLYDETDVESFICLRRAVTYSLSVLACDPEGHKILETMLPEAGPTGLMERALMGYPDFGAAINAATTQQGSMVALGLEVDKVLALAKTVPADDASRALAAVVAQLVVGGRLRSAAVFERSPYFVALQLMGGTVINRESVELRNAGKWLLEKNGGQPVHGFRPYTLARHANEMVQLYKSEAVKTELDSYVDAVRSRVNFWHALKFGVGTIGVYLGTRNLQEVVDRLGEKDGSVLVNSLTLASGMLATGSAIAVLGETGHQRRQGGALGKGNAAAADAAEKLADRYGNWAVGLLALSAATASFKELRNAFNASSGKQAGGYVVGGALQGAASTLGGLHLLGRLYSQESKLGLRLVPLLEAAGRGSGAVGRAARVAFAATRLGSGPVGWTLLAIEVAYQVVSAWNERTVKEDKVTDWLARGIWGIGVRRRWLRGDENLTPFTSLEETTGFYQFFMEPRVETNVAVLRTLGSVLIPGWMDYNLRRHGSTLPSDARTVTVALPGWQPQVGRYEIVQYNEFKMTGIQRTLNDPDLVKLKDGIGYVSYPTDTLGGDIHVKYWPNAFAEPDVVLLMEKT
ncbi:TPA: hypothetical protein ACYLM8_003680 [Burkholderia lata]